MDQKPASAPYPAQGGAYPPVPQGGPAPYPPQGAPGQYPAQGAPPAYTPGYGQPPPPQPVASTVVIAAPLRFGEAPVPMRCQFCQADIVTGTAAVTGLGTWLVAGACCIFGLWFGCCLIPFCIDSLKDVHHSCPNCHRMVGKYQRIS